MKIDKSNINDKLLRIAIDGDLDASSAIQVDNIIQAAFKESRYHILVDCALLDYISSAGLGVFISHLDDFQRNGGSFVFFNMKPTVYNVFELLGLHDIFLIVNNESAALDLLLNTSH